MKGSFSSIGMFAVLLCGCAHQAVKRHPYWGNDSVLKSNESPDTLNAQANDSNAPDRNRALAVFRLFATYVRPAQSAGEVHKVLPNTNWLRTAKAYTLGSGSGYAPVKTWPDPSFVILLFPDKQGQSDWRIYLVLSGHPQHGPAQADEALRFLEGDPIFRSDARIEEFAPSFVGGIPAYTARTERFSQRGLDVYDW